jgi:hypothetical protein
MCVEEEVFRAAARQVGWLDPKRGLGVEVLDDGVAMDSEDATSVTLAEVHRFGELVGHPMGISAANCSGMGCLFIRLTPEAD